MSGFTKVSIYSCKIDNFENSISLRRNSLEADFLLSPAPFKVFFILFRSSHIYLIFPVRINTHDRLLSFRLP